jgi:hypothetical protein
VPVAAQQRPAHGLLCCSCARCRPEAAPLLLTRLLVAWALRLGRCPHHCSQRCCCLCCLCCVRLRRAAAVARQATLQAWQQLLVVLVHQSLARHLRCCWLQTGVAWRARPHRCQQRARPAGSSATIPWRCCHRLLRRRGRQLLCCSCAAATVVLAALRSHQLMSRGWPAPWQLHRWHCSGQHDSGAAVSVPPAAASAASPCPDWQQEQAQRQAGSGLVPLVVRRRLLPGCRCPSC